jgi:hypothetical protein
MDPAFQLVLRAAFALLLATAASHKLRDLPRFREVLADYDIVPRAFAPVVAVALAGFEAILAAVMLSGTAVPAAGVATSTLLLGYAAAISINVRRGRVDIDCGCMGPASRVPLGRGLVVRNLLLASAAALLAVPALPRALEWLDLAAVTASTAVLAACWLASERMLVLAPRVVELRRKMS